MTEIKIYGHIKETKRGRGKTEVRCFHNCALFKSKAYCAENLTLKTPKPVYVTKMLFGDGGFDEETGKLQEVNPQQTALFGTTRARLDVVGQVSPEMRNKAIFVATLRSEDANGYFLNEMALELNTGELYSISTFSGFIKEPDFELTYDWEVTYI